MLLERAMLTFLTRFLLIVISRLRSRARLEAKNLVLPQQVLILTASLHCARGCETSTG